jgi:hypothetical protein
MNYTILIENVSNLTNLTISKSKEWACYVPNYTYLLFLNVVFMTLAYNQFPEKLDKALNYPLNADKYRLLRGLLMSKTYISSAQMLNMGFLLWNIFVPAGLINV